MGAVDTSAEHLKADWQSSTSQIIDLTDAGCVIPGFVESHAHPLIAARFKNQVDCSPDAVSSLSEVQERLAKRASKTPRATWVRGWGLEPCLLCEFANDFRTNLIRQGDLDSRMSKEQKHKVAVSSNSGHL